MDMLTKPSAQMLPGMARSEPRGVSDTPAPAYPGVSRTPSAWPMRFTTTSPVKVTTRIPTMSLPLSGESS